VNRRTVFRAGSRPREGYSDDNAKGWGDPAHGYGFGFGQSPPLPAVIIAPVTSPPTATLPQSASICFCAGGRLRLGRGMKIDKDSPRTARNGRDNGKIEWVLHKLPNAPKHRVPSALKTPSL